MRIDAFRPDGDAPRYFGVYPAIVTCLRMSWKQPHGCTVEVVPSLPDGAPNPDAYAELPQDMRDRLSKGERTGE